MKNISNNDIAHSLYLALKDKQGAELTKILKNSVRFLYNKGLLSKADNIISRLEKIENKDNDRIIVKISCAQPLSLKSKSEISKILMHRYSSKNIDLREVIDSKLLGGWKIETGDEIIDSSIKGKINKLQAQLTS